MQMRGKVDWLKRVSFLFFAMALCLVGCSDASDSEELTNNASVSCGDGEIQAPEACDGAKLGGASCASLGFAGGELGCKSDCGGYDVTKCEAPLSCGDGEIQAPEVCDGANLDGASCASLGFSGGELGCAANCSGYDVAGCGWL